jgi:hypothetical protein
MSTAVNSTHTSVPASSRALSSSANHSHADPGYTNGHHHHHHDVGGASGTNAAKKGKGKKTTDPNEASNLIAAKISQLELDAAGEQEQEAEIGWLKPVLIPSICAVVESGSHNKRPGYTSQSCDSGTRLLCGTPVLEFRYWLWTVLRRCYCTSSNSLLHQPSHMETLLACSVIWMDLY